MNPKLLHRPVGALLTAALFLAAVPTHRELRLLKKENAILKELVGEPAIPGVGIDCGRLIAAT